MGLPLTGKVQHIALHSSNLLIHSINNLQHVADGLLAPTVDLVQDPLKGLGFSVDHLVASHRGGTTQELGHGVELSAQCFLRGLGSIGDSVCTDSFQFLLAILGQVRFLSRQTLLILGSKLLVDGDLFFDLSSGLLKGSLSLVLGLLVTVDLLIRDQLIERLIFVLGEDGIDLGAGILKGRCQ